VTEQQRRQLQFTIAQLRHAYWNLVASTSLGRWEREQRASFAEGLIASEIRRLEDLEAELEAEALR